MNSIFTAAQILDEDVQITLMQALIDIGRTSADALPPYFETLGQLTEYFIDSTFDKAANLIIEFWTSICELEIERL